MSSFSYIAFPREVDKSCLHSKFDESKAFTIGEIRGTELEKQYGYSTEGLPDNLRVYLGDWFDFHGVKIFERGEVSFNDVFANPYIYGIQATFKLLDENETLSS